MVVGRRPFLYQGATNLPCASNHEMDKKLRGVCGVRRCLWGREKKGGPVFCLRRNLCNKPPIFPPFLPAFRQNNPCGENGEREEEQIFMARCATQSVLPLLRQSRPYQTWLVFWSVSTLKLRSFRRNLSHSRLFEKSGSNFTRSSKSQDFSTVDKLISPHLPKLHSL